MNRRAGFVWLAMVAALACSPIATPEPSVAVRVVSTGDYAGIAWLTSGTLVAARAVAATPAGNRLSFEFVAIDPISGEERVLDVTADPACWREIYLSPQNLPSGRLGFVRTCVHSVNGVPPDESDVLGMDLQSLRTEPLMRLGDLTGSKAPVLSINAAGDTVFYDIGAGICAGIAVARKDMPEDRLNAVVSGDGHSFNLNTPANLHGPCDGEGRAGAPALSPDGEWLAFGASPGSVGVSGVNSRLKAPWNLYVLSLGGATPIQIASGLAGASGIAWSPDGSVISFVGSVNGAGEGLWFAHPSGASPTLIAKGDFDSLAWSTDGKQIAALLSSSTDQESATRRIVILEVPDALRPTAQIGR
jgi:hypothetical protein